MIVILAGPGWNTQVLEGDGECVGVCELQERAARRDHEVGGNDDASSRAGRDYERWLLCLTAAGTRVRWWWPQGRGTPCNRQHSGPPAVSDPAATKGARHWNRELSKEKECGAPRNGVIMGCKREAPLGKLRDLSHPPIAVQSLHSPVISIFIQSHSHSHRRHSASGPENHARSRLNHPLWAPESRTLCDPEVSTSKAPFPLPGPDSAGFCYYFFLTPPSEG